MVKGSRVMAIVFLQFRNGSNLIMCFILVKGMFVTLEFFVMLLTCRVLNTELS